MKMEVILLAIGDDREIKVSMFIFLNFNMESKCK